MAGIGKEAQKGEIGLKTGGHCMDRFAQFSFAVTLQGCDFRRGHRGDPDGRLQFRPPAGARDSGRMSRSDFRCFCSIGSPS